MSHDWNRNDLGHHIAGLTDGDGSFSIAIPEDKRRPGKHIFQPIFSLGQAECDKEVVYLVKKVMRCGGVYIGHPQDRPDGCNRMDYYNFRVSSVRDCYFKVVPFFDKFPLLAPTKRQAFEVWRAAVMMLYNRGHLLKGGLEKMQHMRDELMKINKGISSNFKKEDEILQTSLTVTQEP